MYASVSVYNPFIIKHNVPLIFFSCFEKQDQICITWEILISFVFIQAVSTHVSAIPIYRNIYIWIIDVALPASKLIYFVKRLCESHNKECYRL